MLMLLSAMWALLFPMPAYAASSETARIDYKANGSMHAAQQGGWVYYRYGNWEEAKLYKSKLNGKSKTAIHDGPVKNIIAVGDWVYFKDLMTREFCRVKNDGTGLEVLKADTDTQYYSKFCISDGWIICSRTALGQRAVLCRMKLDGSNEKVISKDISSHVDWSVSGGYIYYKKDDLQPNNRFPLYRMNLDGSGSKALMNDLYWGGEFSVDGNWVYYNGEGNRLYKMKLDGTGMQELTADQVQGIAVHDGWVYYYTVNTGPYRLVRVKTDGSGRKELYKGYAHDLSVVDGWVYFDVGTDEHKFTKMTTSGKSVQRLK